MKCIKCNSENFEEDPISGEAVCVICGVISESYDMGNEVEFIENEFGQSQAVGKLQYSGNLSKLRTREKAKIIIDELCKKFQYTSLHEEKALKFFSILLEKGKTKGYTRKMTAAGCLYLAARLLLEPILLLDVSNKIDVSVYRLGKLCNRLKKVLGLELKASQPSCFVETVVAKFEFSNNNNHRVEIIKSALKILQLMENDNFITPGNPKMIAVAAVVISAKLHRVHVQYASIWKQIGIHPNAVDKFINKWKNSPISGITLAEFRKIDLIENRKRIESDKFEIKTSIQIETDSGEDIDLSDSDSDELEQIYLNPKSQ